MLGAGTKGPVVVLVHGTGSHADRWSRSLDALATAGYHPYAFDLPGHGFAAKGPGVECSVPAYKKVLADFMNAIRADKAVIAGTSLGGRRHRGGAAAAGLSAGATRAKCKVAMRPLPGRALGRIGHGFRRSDRARAGVRVGVD